MPRIPYIPSSSFHRTTFSAWSHINSMNVFHLFSRFFPFYNFFFFHFPFILFRKRVAVQIRIAHWASARLNSTLLLPYRWFYSICVFVTLGFALLYLFLQILIKLCFLCMLVDGCLCAEFHFYRRFSRFTVIKLLRAIYIWRLVCRQYSQYVEISKENIWNVRPTETPTI